MNSVKVNDAFNIMRKRFYDEDVVLCVALIPKTFPSLHCLQLHNVPDFDSFFKACAPLVSLRILELSFRDTVLNVDIPRKDRAEEFTTSYDQIMKNTPPLEVLRIAVSFDSGHDYFFSGNREKATKQIITIIRASSSTLFELSIFGNGNIYFETLGLNRTYFPRLRRVGFWSVMGRVFGIRKFILAHQPNLSEVNLDYSCAHLYATLSCLSRIMRGLCPREGNQDAIDEDEEKIETFVHPEDRKWGHFECDKFAYAKREGNVVEISLSFPQFDVNGDDVDSNDDLRIFKLSPFLRQFTHLEILTLAACRHDERNFARLMVRDLA